MDVGKDWKKKLGFPINYDSDQSPEDDFDAKDVVMRPPHSSVYLLNDHGDGAEADLLGTTPPRERIRNNQKRKTFMDTIMMRDSNGKRDDSPALQSPAAAAMGTERIQKHLSLSRKFRRARERDMKQDSAQRETKADSLPATEAAPAVPVVVESCNRFMSLTSRLKCRESGAYGGGGGEGGGAGAEGVERRRAGADPTAPGADTIRANFHNTFSLLINMGNMGGDKGCKRTISREEQVWQNELKDLIWLELQAKIAGRTLAQQDAYLCAQRNVVPTIVQNIRDYRFVNVDPCKSSSSRLCVIQGSLEDLSQDADRGRLAQDPKETDNDVDCLIGCLAFSCRRCSEAVGKAMREVGTLLDSFYNATTLYPSSKAMTADHPLIATQLFKDRFKAMCLWYNTALYMRLKVLAVRRMLRVMGRRAGYRHLRSHDSDVSGQSSSEPRPCTVRFDVATPPATPPGASSATPTDSNSSESSGHSDASAHKDAAADEPDSPPAPAQHGEGDEVDSGLDKRLDQSGETTPEIVLPDSKYGTTDTVTSTESGYGTSHDGHAHAHAPAHAAGDAPRHSDDVYDIGSLEDMTRLRLLDRCPVSQYRSYHHEMLKTQGVRRCMMFMNKMRLNVLHKVYLTLEKPHSDKSESVPEDDPVEVFDDTKEDEDKATNKEQRDFKKEYELRRYGCWSEESLAMRLPSYRHHFLLLSSVCMEAVHDYLSLRLEDRPQNPSCLTVKQLIHELKEGLDIATEMRAAFARNIEVALAGHTAGATARQDLLLLVRTYDATVETVLKQYLSYVRTMSEVEHLSRWTLQAEWGFTARLAKRTKCAALLAPVTFSEIACNQLDRILKQFDEKFSQLEELEKSETDPKKQVVYTICREAQGIYASEREATLQAAQWARALAARLARAPPPAYTTQRGNIFNSLMSLRDRIVQQTQYILERSRAGPEDSEEVMREYEGVFARVRELLLQVYKLGFELHKELYKFAQAPFKLLDERCVRRARPASLQPVRRARSGAADLRPRRPETMLVHDARNPLMVHKELHRFVNESWGGRGALAGGGRRGGGAAPGGSPPRGGRPKFLRSESIGEDAETNVFDDKLFENINNFNENQTSSIELLLSGEPAPIEQAECKPAAIEARISEQETQWAARVGRAVVQFARCWMRFVVERCDTGRGLRPRWASQGLEFLMLACDPCNTKHLTDKEFEELKKEMDGCISHVIGSRHPPAHPAPRAPDTACASPDPARRRPRHSPMSSCSTSSAGKEVPTPPTPPTEPEPLLNFQGMQPEAHSQRVSEAVSALDGRRDAELRERRAVGRVLESAAVASYEPKLRQLKFKWQRGLKIGAGTFGKVYTVVNTESGQLLAMKELGVGAGDRRALQRAANELRVLEGVVHPHLVRYYGCELHREEMLLFMELCVEGSLEALVATSGALAEHTVRRYTKQLLSAVRELHARAIAHRDIKSGNIFLTNEGHCLKLGDFGCAVKIRANTTAAGELQGCVGTQAYMAPEVFMQSTGHGRAADIWSLGCVVTEMASGKRPFPEYDSNYQIMFVVGMGGRPRVPDTLSEEGQQFCRGCLTHEPDQRPRAEHLMLHHFLKVKSDDDCQCEPAYLMP